jgi:hypothetical protein
VRFHTDASGFEGYNAAGGVWTSLGGALDADGDTFVVAVSAAGANVDTVHVETAGSERARVEADGRILFDAAGMGVNSPAAWAAHSAVLRGSSVLQNVTTVEGAALRVPVGGDTERPVAPKTGPVRFSKDASRFEGYSAATGAWSTLGCVSDAEGDTLAVAAEAAPRADNNRVRVVTAGEERVRVVTDGQQRRRLAIRGRHWHRRRRLAIADGAGNRSAPGVSCTGLSWLSAMRSMAASASTSDDGGFLGYHATDV